MPALILAAATNHLVALRALLEGGTDKAGQILPAQAVFELILSVVAVVLFKSQVLCGQDVKGSKRGEPGFA